MVAAFVWIPPINTLSKSCKLDDKVNCSDKLSVMRQCQLAGIARSTVYASKELVSNEYELILLGLLDEEYTRHPFYGSRKMTVWLRIQGHTVNRKHVQRLMRILGLAGMVPGPNTRKKIRSTRFILICSEG